VDQGVHNVLVHDGTLERNGVKVLRHNQRQGTVANMQAGVAKFRGGKVVNGEGRTVDVVHQYDRDEGLQDMLFKTFVDWDMSEVHEGTGACSGYKIKENTEVRSNEERSDNRNIMPPSYMTNDLNSSLRSLQPYKGRCDLSHDGGSDYMECCEVCNSKPSCKVRSDEERSDDLIQHSAITNHLLLVASLLPARSSIAGLHTHKEGLLVEDLREG